MNNVPRNIRAALRQRVITPLAEVIVGLRSPDQLHELATAAVTIRLTDRAKSARSVKVLDVKAQRTYTPAMEVSATVEVDGSYHAIAVRVEVRKGRLEVTAVETDLG